MTSLAAQESYDKAKQANTDNEVTEAVEVAKLTGNPKALYDATAATATTSAAEIKARHRHCCRVANMHSYAPGLTVLKISPLGPAAFPWFTGCKGGLGPGWEGKLRHQQKADESAVSAGVSPTDGHRSQDDKRRHDVKTCSSKLRYDPQDCFGKQVRTVVPLPLPLSLSSVCLCLFISLSNSLPLCLSQCLSLSISVCLSFCVCVCVCVCLPPLSSAVAPDLPGNRQMIALPNPFESLASHRARTMALPAIPFLPPLISRSNSE